MNLPARLQLMIRGFPADPHRYGPQIRELRSQYPEEFLDAATRVLRDAKETPGTFFLVSTLVSEGKLVPLLFDLAQTQAPALSRIVRVSAQDQPTLHLDIVKLMDKEGDQDRLLVYMRILEAAGDGLMFVPMLRKLMASPYPKVKSKATLLMGQTISKEGWFIGQMNETDERVRANAVEALWELDLPRRKSVFEKASQDPAARVAANGWIGLYRCGAVDSLKGLAQMTASTDARQRASGAWAMGTLGDSRFVEILERLKRDEVASVSSNAVRALERIQALPPAPAATASGVVRFLRAVPGQADFIVLEESTGSAVHHLRALDVRARLGGVPVLDYALGVTAEHAAVAITAAVPQWRDVDTFAAQFKETGAQTQTGDWNVVAYAMREAVPEGRNELPEVLLAAVQGTPDLRKSRHLIVLLPADIAASSWPSERMEPFERDLAKARTALHIVCEGSPWRGWRKLCEDSAGFLIAVDSLDSYSSTLNDLACALRHRWRLAFSVEKAAPGAELELTATSGGLQARGSTKLAIVRKPV